MPATIRLFALKRRVAGILFAALFLCLAPGCQPFVYKTPGGFVELPHQHEYDYRAVNAEGVVLAVRAIRHEPKGDLGFWARSVEKEVRLLGGYALVDSRPVTTRSGLSGRQLRFGHDEGQSPSLYQVTLFITDPWIFLLEAGGPKSEVDKVGQEIEGALSQFALR